MSTLIIGAHGSMGKRYQAILKYLEKPFMCVDKDHTDEETQYLIHNSDRYIIATPTHTHLNMIYRLVPYKRPILCEKPITKSIDGITKLGNILEQYQTPFRMMNQYVELAGPGEGEGYYNFYNHGKDGLAWDCIQIIGLSGKVILRESSPIWECTVNDVDLHLCDMDAAYIAYVERWFKTPNQHFFEILDMHVKTDKLAREMKRYENTIH